MPTTSSSALRYPDPSAAPNVAQDLQNLATDLDRKVIPAFANITARNTAIPSPVQGQTCSVGGVLHIHDGAGWRWERRGTVTGTTDASGFLVVPHGLGAAPTGVLMTPGNQATDLLNRILTVNCTGTDSANFVIYAKRTDTSAAIAPSLIVVSWLAFT